MKRRTEMMRRTGTALLVALSLSTAALAAEVDRITVEDPLTSVVKFGVTSDGNVRGTSFAGDGAALTNVPHWKGTWSAATAYNKDECVYYGGSSYIALQGGTNLVPNVSPAYWVVLAAQGPAGSAGAQGTPGAPGTPGAQGIPGTPGKDGSPDDQAAIVTKLTNAKLHPGQISVNSTSATSQIEVAADGGPNAELKLRVASNSAGVPNFFGSRAGGSLAAPVATPVGKGLFVLGATGYTPSGWTSALAGLIGFYTTENWTDTSTGTEIRFSTTAKGSATRAEQVRIADNGNFGIGTTAPGQKLEVNGGIRINTTAPKLACDGTNQGTFWFTKGAAGAKDVIEVCAKDAGNAYGWRLIW